MKYNDKILSLKCRKQNQVYYIKETVQRKQLKFKKKRKKTLTEWILEHILSLNKKSIVSSLIIELAKIASLVINV